MFKSEKPYKGLDDYFLTNIEQLHSRSNTEIEKRIKEIESIYQEWPFNPNWKHPNDRGWKNAFCLSTVNLMAQAANCYILGFYETSVMASSAAVEQIIHVDIDPKVKHVKIREHEEYIIQNYGTLNKILLKAKKNGYPTNLLLDSNEVFLDECTFVQRRNMIAHGAYENQFPIEQVHYSNFLVISPDIPNIEYTMFNGKASFDQYKKASNFIIETFRWFEKTRHSILNLV